jgi:hypothetical protein
MIEIESKRRTVRRLPQLIVCALVVTNILFIVQSHAYL